MKLVEPFQTTLYEDTFRFASIVIRFSRLFIKKLSYYSSRKVIEKGSFWELIN